MSLLSLQTPLLFKPRHSLPSTNGVVYASTSAAAPKKSRRKKPPKQLNDNGSPLSFVVSAEEKNLRFAFMEELMHRARNRDTIGVSDVIYDMIAAGLSPGPRSFHGLIVAHTLNGDHEGAMQSLRRELSAGHRPLHETCIALIRLFGSKGFGTRGLELLAAMGKLNYDIRRAWILLVEELVRGRFMEDANRVFLKGANGGLRATDELYDLMIEEDLCRLLVEYLKYLFATFENMEYGGEDYMKPDTESYNWVIQAYTRAESYDRVQDVAELLGMMVEDHKRIQPNVKTYSLLVECFSKYCVVREAIRHFRALRKFEGGTKVLHHEGKFGDPLSLYLRALCREGRIVDLLEALEAMAKDNQPIPPRAMILSRKYRTLVSSWIEPLQEEAELGYEIDYVARYIAEGGLTGERKRWVPRRGLAALGDASESDYLRVEERLRKIIRGPDRNVLKPKAASKMLVSELKDELEAQGLPTDGTRNVLYQRVQKARRINRSRGRPLWVPPVEEEEEEVDEEVDELISRIQLHEGDTEFWKRRFLGEGFDGNHVKPVDVEASELPDELDEDEDDDDDDDDDIEDVAKEVEDEEADEEGGVEVEEQSESQDAERIVKAKEAEAKKPLQMIGVQLLKDSDQTSRMSKKSRRRAARLAVADDDDDDWFPEDILEAFKEMRNRKVFDVEDMYTIADAWGWTWEREVKKRPLHRWSQEWEVELAIKLMLKVIELGGTPTIGDCAMILRAAIRAPMPSAFLKILQTTHSLGYQFGSSLYDEIISLCVELGELDAAIAIVADLETAGIAVPDQTLDRVISAKQAPESAAEETLS
ncbi:hypothetical protein OIU84_027633 [Salix udensis]|uniref:SAP domain-containing protein n=1 Tax=Salix udensis TaxID=889485 RepID=A0AAD6KHC8_9ROSI|nr:hypothetical protein OIU84_027633 [Salix udensis]